MNQKIIFEIKKFNNNALKAKSLPTAVLFTDRKKISDFDAVIKNLPKNSAIIIREYDLGKKEREIFAQKITNLARPLGIKILIGKDFLLAQKIKADGIHFSDLDKLPLVFLKKQSFKKNFIFSLACHSFKSIEKSIKFKPDIIFISPIFPTNSHLGTTSLGIINLQKISFKYRNHNYHQTKISALGGINLDNIASI